MATTLRRPEHAIFLVRGNQVMLDWHLAQLYQVPTRVLIQAVKRNIARFPTDFAFRLTAGEFKDLRSQFVISSLERHGGRRTPPYAFTEQGVANESCTRWSGNTTASSKWFSTRSVS